MHVHHWIVPSPEEGVNGVGLAHCKKQRCDATKLFELGPAQFRLEAYGGAIGGFRSMPRRPDRVYPLAEEAWR